MSRPIKVVYLPIPQNKFLATPLFNSRMKWNDQTECCESCELSSSDGALSCCLAAAVTDAADEVDDAIDADASDGAGACL